MTRTLRKDGWILALMIATMLGYRQSPERTVTIRVISNSVPPSSFLSITGNNGQLRNWKPEGVRLEHRADSVWDRTFHFEQGLDLQFKINRGSWRTEEMDPRGI